MPSNSPLHFLKPIDSRTRGVAILEALAEMIDRAGLTVGDRLPPEVQLAAQLGVGRSTIREALNRWEGLGLIRRRRGDGTYLAAPVPQADGPVPLMVRLEGEALLRLLEVRRTLEADVCRYAALRASAAQRAEIDRRCSVLLDIVAARGSYRLADEAFHNAVSDASGNPLFGQILSRLGRAFEKAHDSPFSLNNFGIASFPMHRDLAEAILAADPERAAAAANELIDSVYQEVRLIVANGPQKT